MATMMTRAESEASAQRLAEYRERVERERAEGLRPEGDSARFLAALERWEARRS